MKKLLIETIGRHMAADLGRDEADQFEIVANGMVAFHESESDGGAAEWLNASVPEYYNVLSAKAYDALLEICELFEVEA